jgi:carbamoyl-phosphate synthase large subunit
MPLHPALRNLGRPPKVLLLGSGGLSIGQAGEFDYSGTQALKAMQEEGIEVIVVNPNIATVQTNPDSNAKVYLYPVSPEWVEKVIVKERPDAVVAGFGGQTALGCLLALDDLGILARYQVKNLGTQAPVLRMTEDRDLFAKKMREIGMPVPTSFACETVDSAVTAAETIGYPVILRAAYALGGLGSGFANNKDELLALARPALVNSPQVLIEKSLRGWKEIEYEVMRDGEGNTITICNMENFDPLGIHTGDSIVVCPSQSLSDEEYQILRNASLLIVKALGVVGECNVQIALDPKSLDFFIIEVNARLSRSSALASKATGYPIAYIAAKVVLGYDLLELKNPVTGVTYAFFEPALDYITMKIPRWDLSKFRGVSRLLGSTMKSVGEVMAIGRSFPEVLQKAVRMVTERAEGLSLVNSETSEESLVLELERPTDTRLYTVVQALRQGMDIDYLHKVTSIDKWFLAQTRIITDIEKEISDSARESRSKLEFIKSVDEKIWRRWKKTGFGDEQIAFLYFKAKGEKFLQQEMRALSLEIRKARLDHNVKPVIKKIDTTAGEYPSPSNYLYLTYGGSFDDPLPDDGKVFSAVVLGCGAYRIGTSVEFDWCAVSCSRRLQAAGWRSIIMNCNPETVSTDYNSSDRLYFEELTLERILDVFAIERSVGAVVSMGGQLPNKLALPLAQAGIKLLGHSPETIDLAEDRQRFSKLLDQLEIDQPRWICATSVEEMNEFVKRVGFPVLIRPSYVLSGAAMNVAYNRDSLTLCIGKAVEVSSEHPIVVSEFIEGAREIEFDGVARNGAIITAVVSEHVENAGVHSGDATMVVPAQNLYMETIRRVRRAGEKIAKALQLNGPFNIQFLAKRGDIKVIECNARAARSFPFVSKVIGLNLADVATDIMVNREPSIFRLREDELPYVGVKAAMFSFTRLGGADPILGVEMASTGEVGCISKSFDESLLLAMQASNVKRPRKGVLVSSGKEKTKLKFLSSAQILQKLGIPIFATAGTADYLIEHGIKATKLDWPGESDNDVIHAIRSGLVDSVINIPKSAQRQEITHGMRIRQAAVQFGCSLFTNVEAVKAYIHALDRCPDFIAKHEVESLPNYRNK